MLRELQHISHLITPILLFLFDPVHKCFELSCKPEECEWDNWLTLSSEQPLRCTHVLCSSENHLTLSISAQPGWDSIWTLPVKNMPFRCYKKQSSWSPYCSQSYQLIWKRSRDFKMCRCFRFKTGICLCRHTLCSKNHKGPPKGFMEQYQLEHSAL